VRVEVLTDRPDERFRAGARVMPEESARALVIAEASAVADGPGWWLRFVDVADRTVAQELVGVYLEAEVEPASEHEPDAVWWHEVVGSDVRDLQGRSLGVVRDVYRAGAAEVYAVDGGPAGAFDVPAVRDVIREFAPREGRIVVDTEALGLDEARQPRRPRGRRSSKAAIDGVAESRTNPSASSTSGGG
jgi:16S rRNA processing protein RimM